MASMTDLLSLKIMVFFSLLEGKSTASNMATVSAVYSEQYDGKTKTTMVTPILFVRATVVEMSLLDPSANINSQSSLYGCIVSLYNWTYSMLLVDCLRCCCVTLIPSAQI